MIFLEKTQKEISPFITENFYFKQTNIKSEKYGKDKEGKQKWNIK